MWEVSELGFHPSRSRSKPEPRSSYTPLLHSTSKPESTHDSVWSVSQVINTRAGNCNSHEPPAPASTPPRPFFLFLNSAKKTRTFRTLPATSSSPSPRACSLGRATSPPRPQRSLFGSRRSSVPRNSPRTVASQPLGVQGWGLVGLVGHQPAVQTLEESDPSCRGGGCPGKWDRPDPVCTMHVT